VLQFVKGHLLSNQKLIHLSKIGLYKRVAKLTSKYLWIKYACTLDLVLSEICDLCEISDLLLFANYFASQCKRIKFGDYFFDVCCVN